MQRLWSQRGLLVEHFIFCRIAAATHGNVLWSLGVHRWNHSWKTPYILNFKFEHFEFKTAHPGANRVVISRVVSTASSVPLLHICQIEAIRPAASYHIKRQVARRERSLHQNWLPLLKKVNESQVKCAMLNELRWINYILLKSRLQ